MVARFEGFEIDVEDLDERILSLPASERPGPGQDLDAWYRDQVQQLVVERVLRAEAEEGHLQEDEAFVAARRNVETQLGVQLCLREMYPELGEVTEEALRAAYEEHSQELSSSERRSVFHLYLRADPEGQPEKRQTIESLRDQVLAGESFMRLATSHSVSESRHREGALGWVTPGQLPAGFEEVIFTLEEGVPSEPVTTNDGLHLFFVDQILPARQLSFEEARAGLRTRLIAERTEEALNEVQTQAEELGQSTDSIDRDEFAEIVASDDPTEVLLDLSDTELTLGDLRRQLRQTQRSAGARRAPSVEQAWQLLTQLRRRSLVHDYCESSQRIDASQLDAQLERWQDGALLDSQRQRQMVEIARSDQTRLRMFYESNIGLFSTAPTWHLRRLAIPLADDSQTTMAKLERAASSSSGPDLEQLQAQLGGEIDDLGSKSLAELGRLELKLPALVAPLSVGGLSAPYRTSTTLEIVESIGRQDAEPLPFDEVADRAAVAYVEQYTREVYRELNDRILKRGDLEILPEGLAAVREAGTPEAEISVEELEALLDEL